MKEVFGKGGSKGRESYGLRFAGVERIEMLDVEGAELLFIASRSGEEGLETSLGEGRGNGEYPRDAELTCTKYRRSLDRSRESRGEPPHQLSLEGACHRR